MKITPTSTFLLLITMLGLPTLAHAEQLSGDQVRALISDKTVYAYHEKKDFDIVTYFSADGTFKSLRRGDVYPGKWRIDGDKHCIRRNDPFSGQPRKERCMYIEKDGDTYKRIKEKGSGKRIHVITYKRFADGNAEGL